MALFYNDSPVCRGEHRLPMFPMDALRLAQIFLQASGSF
jgi:hypothetical protein